MPGAESNTSIMAIGGVSLEVEIRGSGAPLLLLSNEEQLENRSTLADRLAQKYQLIIPSPPGFGHSERPDWMTRAEDISFVYLDLLEHLKLKDVTVLGCSLGGWIAAEMAVVDDSPFSKIVLADPYGVKIGGPYDRDVQDLWIQTPEKVAAMFWKNPELAKVDYTQMSEDELTVVARNKETFARFCWEPYMHNPKLMHRLHRIGVPTLVVWGDNDGVVTKDYGKAYAGLIPGAKFETIADAGHYPQLENTDAFLATFERFAG
ncbi:MAG: alpha/beta fold hydrolase [Beijerinckiaceae bacterium]